MACGKLQPPHMGRGPGFLPGSQCVHLPRFLETVLASARPENMGALPTGGPRLCGGRQMSLRLPPWLEVQEDGALECPGICSCCGPAVPETLQLDLGLSGRTCARGGCVYCGQASRVCSAHADRVLVSFTLLPHTPTHVHTQHTHMCTHTQTCIHMHTQYTHACTHVHNSPHVHTETSTHMHTPYMHACAHTYMCTQFPTRAHTMHTHTCTHTPRHAPICTMYMHACVHAHMHTQLTHMHTQCTLHTCTHSGMHTYAQTQCTCMCMHTSLPPHTQSWKNYSPAQFFFFQERDSMTSF